MEQIVTYLLMVQKFTKLKQKILKFQWVQYVLETFQKDWSVDNMKTTEFTGYVYDFSVDYDGISVDDIKDIYKYLMKKNYVI